MASRRPVEPLPFRRLQPTSPRMASPFVQVRTTPTADRGEVESVLNALARLSPTISGMAEREHKKYLSVEAEETRQRVLDAERENSVTSFREFERQNEGWLGASPWRGVFAAQQFGRQRAIRLEREINDPEFLGGIQSLEEYDAAVADRVSSAYDGMAFYERAAFDEAVQDKVVPQSRGRAGTVLRGRNLKQSVDGLGDAWYSWFDEVGQGLDPTEATTSNRDQTWQEFYLLNGERGEEVIAGAMREAMSATATRMAVEGAEQDEIYERLTGMVTAFESVRDGSGTAVSSTMEREIDGAMEEATTLSRNAANIAAERRQRQETEAVRRANGVADKWILRYKRGLDGDLEEGENPVSWEEVLDGMEKEMRGLDWPSEEVAEGHIATLVRREYDGEQVGDSVYADLLIAASTGEMSRADLTSHLSSGGMADQQKTSLLNTWMRGQDAASREYAVTFREQFNATAARVARELTSQGYEVTEVDRRIQDASQVFLLQHIAAMKEGGDFGQDAMDKAMSGLEGRIRSRVMADGLGRQDPWAWATRTIEGADPETAAMVRFAIQSGVPEAARASGDPLLVQLATQESEARLFQALLDAVSDPANAEDWRLATREAIKAYAAPPEPGDPADEEVEEKPQPDPVQTAVAQTGSRVGPFAKISEGVVGPAADLSADLGYGSEVFTISPEARAAGVSSPADFLAVAQRVEGEDVSSAPLGRALREEIETYREWHSRRAEALGRTLRAVAIAAGTPVEGGISTLYSTVSPGAVVVYNGKLGKLGGDGDVVQDENTDEMTRRVIFAVTRYQGVNTVMLRRGGVTFNKVGVESSDGPWRPQINIGRRWMSPRSALWVTTLAEYERQYDNEAFWKDIANAWNEVDGDSITWEDVRAYQGGVVRTYGHDIPARLKQ